mmetsp:Transcript_61339/g.143473  ORF Transcript_61339/g.143473 Transcript_61339/m.143473 type:complete len:220 (+) Transcript_61339:139-798(+)
MYCRKSAASRRSSRPVGWHCLLRSYVLTRPRGPLPSKHCRPRSSRPCPSPTRPHEGGGELTMALNPAMLRVDGCARNHSRAKSRPLICRGHRKSHGSGARTFLAVSKRWPPRAQLWHRLWRGVSSSRSLPRAHQSPTGGCVEQCPETPCGHLCGQKWCGRIPCADRQYQDSPRAQCFSGSRRWIFCFGLVRKCSLWTRPCTWQLRFSMTSCLTLTRRCE